MQGEFPRGVAGALRAAAGATVKRRNTDRRKAGHPGVFHKSWRRDLNLPGRDSETFKNTR